MTALEDELTKATPSRDSYLSIGVFDGVHLGHRHLLDLLRQEALGADCVPGVITFRNHPGTVLNPRVAHTALTTLDERIRLLRGAGIEMVVPVTFSLEISRVPASEFVALLQRYLRMRSLVVGPSFALGHKREGTPEMLQVLGKKLGFSVTVAEARTHSDTMVSSTAVRNAVMQGNVATASQLLGRYYVLEGQVVPGEGRGGSILGYPTANIAVEGNLTLPGDGIYATWAHVGSRRYEAATSIGVRPTFGPGERTVEAFFLDFEGDVYQKSVRLEFVERIRDEVAFESAEALRRQMGLDVEQTKGILGRST